MAKKYAIKPKDPRYNKFWDKKNGGWDSKEHFELERHTTNDPNHASKMCEDASKLDPETNWSAKKPIPVKKVEIEITEKE